MIDSGVEKSGLSRDPHKVKVVGSNPTPRTRIKEIASRCDLVIVAP